MCFTPSTNVTIELTPAELKTVQKFFTQHSSEDCFEAHRGYLIEKKFAAAATQAGL